jgi:hypothetical protein
MKKLLWVPLALIALAANAFAQQPGTAAMSAAPTATSPDKNVETLTSDVYAMARVTAVAEDMNRVRPILLSIADSDIEMLRVPRGDGTYRWASLQREEGGRVKAEKDVEYVSTEKELRNVTVTGANGYRVEVTVPKKRGTFQANNRVYVRNILVDSTGFDGKVQHHELPVNAWVGPGDATGVALPDIGKSVNATAELGVESGKKVAVAEVALVQAKLVDDPGGPYYGAVKKLQQVRDLTAAKDINRGAIKNILDEGLLTLAGQLEKRRAELDEAAQARKLAVETGTTTGSINVGDATPDVLYELSTISQLLGGTLPEQTDARTRLETLLTTLKPKPAPVQ